MTRMKGASVVGVSEEVMAECVLSKVQIIAGHMAYAQTHETKYLRPHMNNTQAQAFANDWVSAWNAHDLDRILAHYSDDFEMTSPVIVQLLSEASGTLKGKAAVGHYWGMALQRVPDLHFELLSVLVGVRSITLYYRGVKGRLSAEVFEFDEAGKVVKAAAHYAL